MGFGDNYLQNHYEEDGVVNRRCENLVTVAEIETSAREGGESRTMEQKEVGYNVKERKRFTKVAERHGRNKRGSSIFENIPRRTHPRQRMKN